MPKYKIASYLFSAKSKSDAFVQVIKGSGVPQMLPRCQAEDLWRSLRRRGFTGEQLLPSFSHLAFKGSPEEFQYLMEQNPPDKDLSPSEYTNPTSCHNIDVTEPYEDTCVDFYEDPYGGDSWVGLYYEFTGENMGLETNSYESAIPPKTD